MTMNNAKQKEDTRGTSSIVLGDDDVSKGVDDSSFLSCVHYGLTAFGDFDLKPVLAVSSSRIF